MIVHGYRPTPNASVLSRSGPMGERCMKGAVHPSVYPSVHQHTCISVQTRRLCTSNSTQFGRGQNTVLGWSDPHFSGARAAKRLWGRSNPTVCPSPSVQAVDGSQGVDRPIVKKVKHAFCTFGAATSSPSVQVSPTRLANSHYRTCETPRAQNLKSGGSDPQFSAFSRPTNFSGSLPPDVGLQSARVVGDGGNALRRRCLQESVLTVKLRERVLSNRQYAAPHTTCTTRLHDERRRVLATLKGTT